MLRYRLIVSEVAGLPVVLVAAILIKAILIVAVVERAIVPMLAIAAILKLALMPWLPVAPVGILPFLALTIAIIEWWAFLERLRLASRLLRLWLGLVELRLLLLLLLVEAFQR